MKKLIVICQNTSYLERFTDTIPKYLPRDWSVGGYETLEEYERHEQQELTAIAEQNGRTPTGDSVSIQKGLLLAQVAEQKREDIRKRLLGSGMAVLWLTESEEQSGEEIFMYRPAPIIATRIIQACREGKPDMAKNEEGFRVIGYVGSEGGAGCTTEAYRQAVALSMKRETSFLCLDQAPGLREC